MSGYVEIRDLFNENVQVGGKYDLLEVLKHLLRENGRLKGNRKGKLLAECI